MDRRIVKIIDGKKLCNFCNKLKLVSEFYKGASVCGLASSCKECERLRHHMEAKIQKMEFIIAYGGKCSCCGEKEIDLLTVEHIRHKGYKLIHTNNTYNLRKRLKELKWPEGYTVLCWNCNMSSRGTVPCCHSKEYKEYEKELEKYLDNDTRKEKYYELKHKLDIINGKVSIIERVK